jgi:heme/copper-type cytochrome/quinol oxidase subunit 2
LDRRERDLTVKVVGHQWYWTYELGDGLGLEFDSYIKGEDYFLNGEYRLLEVDNRLVLPVNITCRFIVTSRDVIHSWALPSFFLKFDAIRGLINVFFYKFNIVGIFFGQCSEICGANHTFMPVVVELTLFDFFKSWLLCF